MQNIYNGVPRTQAPPLMRATVALSSALTLALALALAVVSGVQAETPRLEIPDQDRQAEARMDPATAETVQAIHSLQLPEGSGLEVSLWAAEPLLANPVAFDFDEQGRLYVSETYRYGTGVLDIRAYMGMLEADLSWRTIEERAQGIEDIFGEDARKLEIESERIRLLQDSDGDGVADASSEYAAGFNSTLDGIASGVLARKGAVWFTNIPSLWKLEGLSDEGKATHREELLRGFGVHFNFTGHDLHGLTPGPDGKLYFSIGDRGAVVTAADGTAVNLPDEGAVFRSNYDGTEFELVHRGLRNPQELAFDELGNLFTGDNDGDMGDKERLVQVVEGGDSGWRIGHQHPPLGNGGIWVSEAWWETEFDGFPRFALPPLFHTEDGPSGIAYYPGTGLSPDFAKHLFITHFRGNTATSGVWTYTLEPEGASFRLGEKKEFMRGLLPTDVTFGPDGRFYVLDWVDGWPKSNKGRIYAVSHPDHQGSALVSETQKIIAEGMAGRTVKELAGLLQHANWNVRLEAQLELVARGEAGLVALAEVARAEDAALLARLHATWGLGILAGDGHEAAGTELTALVGSTEDEVKAQAIRMVGDNGIQGVQADLVSALKHPSARVQYFAAQSLGKLGDASAVPALLEAARANAGADRYLEHAIVMGLSGCASHDSLLAARTDPSASVRMAVLLTLRRQGNAAVAGFLEDKDEQIILSAARAINDTPIEPAYPPLAEMLHNPLAANEILGLRAINAHFRIGGAANAQALADYIADESHPDALRLEALVQLTSWAEPFDRDRVIGQYRPLDNRDPAPARQAVAGIASVMLASDNGELAAAYVKATDELKVSGIEENLRQLVLNDSANVTARAAALNKLDVDDDERIGELARLASESNAETLRLAALPIITRREPEQAQATLERMSRGGVIEQRTVYNTLADSTHDFADRLLAERVAAMAAGQVPVAAQLELIKAAEQRESDSVKQALQAFEQTVAEAEDPIAAWQFALEGGNAREGWRVYWGNPALPCIRCHLTTPEGETAGPNLADVALRLDRRELLQSVVDPNAVISDGYQPPSSMPAIFDKLLSRDDLRNLVEALSTLKNKPAAEGEHGK